MIDLISNVLMSIVVLSPFLLLASIGIPAIVGYPLQERSVARGVQIAVCTGLAAACGVVLLMLITGSRLEVLELGQWVALPSETFHFHIKFVFDRLSVPFCILSFVLVGTIGAFAHRYLHREQGYRRFFLFFAIFLLGMVIASLAGTIETLFVGWELVGLSSALLVAYFQTRLNPVRNGFRVWSVYRVSDAAFLLAAVALHHLHGEGDFSGLMGSTPWPQEAAVLPGNQAFLVGLLLLVAAAGKSALIPFSGWLPRAMEGPTPSSAVFYGALSVHLGAFLLLRVSPILEASWLLSACVVMLGLGSALFAAITASVQTDVKSGLAYASLTQVGLITAEIGLGFRYLALIHIIGHACLRTLQLLRAPTLLQDYRALENAIGERLPAGRAVTPVATEPTRQWLYRMALQRGDWDARLDRWIVQPFLRFFVRMSQLEDRWLRRLDGTTPPASAEQAAGEPTAAPVHVTS